MFPSINQLLYMQNTHCKFAECMHAWWCASGLPVPRLWTHVFVYQFTSSCFPLSDINIWENALRQLLAEKPHKSLAVTTWERSSEGHAFHWDYKQHRESRDHNATIELTHQCLWCCCFATITLSCFFCFFIAVVRLQAVACAGICSHILIMIAKDSCRFMPFTLCNCSQYFWR